MQNMTLPIYRKKNVFNVKLSIDGKRPGLYITALATDSDERPVPSTEISFSLGLEEVGKLIAVTESSFGPCEFKMIHKKGGDFKAKESKTLNLTRKDANTLMISLSQTGYDDGKDGSYSTIVNIGEILVINQIAKNAVPPLANYKTQRRSND